MFNIKTVKEQEIMDTEKANLGNIDSEKMDFLVNSGLMEAYEYVLRSLCKAGLPEGNVYEYSALKVLKFEKSFRAEQRKKELLEKYKVENMSPIKATPQREASVKDSSSSRKKKGKK